MCISVATATAVAVNATATATAALDLFTSLACFFGSLVGLELFQPYQLARALLNFVETSESLAFSCINSIFLASSSSFGTP